MTTDTYTTAARIIAIARRLSDMTTPAFDYEVASGGTHSVAWMHLDSATYQVANEHLPEIVEGSGQAELDLRTANWKALAAQIGPELDRYAERCRARRYTGWSAGHGPIRYAD